MDNISPLTLPDCIEMMSPNQVSDHPTFSTMSNPRRYHCINTGTVVYVIDLYPTVNKVEDMNQRYRIPYHEALEILRFLDYLRFSTVVDIERHWPIVPPLEIERPAAEYNGIEWLIKWGVRQDVIDLTDMTLSDDEYEAIDGPSTQETEPSTDPSAGTDMAQPDMDAANMLLDLNAEDHFLDEIGSFDAAE